MFVCANIHDCIFPELEFFGYHVTYLQRPSCRRVWSLQLKKMCWYSFTAVWNQGVASTVLHRCCVSLHCPYLGSCQHAWKIRNPACPGVPRLTEMGFAVDVVLCPILGNTFSVLFQHSAYQNFQRLAADIPYLEDIAKALCLLCRCDACFSNTFSEAPGSFTFRFHVFQRVLIPGDSPCMSCGGLQNGGAQTFNLWRLQSCLCPRLGC